MTEETKKAPKAKTVIDDMAARFVAPDLEQGIAYLQRVSSDFADFGSYPLVAVGMDSEGNFDPAVYSDQTRMMIAKLRKSEGKGDDRTTTIKAIVVGAVPTLDALMASDSGREWVQRIIDKELNHVLVRPLRDAENVMASVSEMPSTMDAFIASGGAGGSTALEAFNESYRDVIDLLAKQSTPFRKARLTKPELRRAIESKAYALKWYEACEDRNGKDSLFVIALKLMIAYAADKGFDSTLLTRWLETRDQTTIDETADDSEDFDLDELTATLTAEPEAETTDETTDETAPTESTDDKPAE